MKDEVKLNQKKTKTSVEVALSYYTKNKLKIWINESEKNLYDFIFTGLRCDKNRKISIRQYQRLVKKWVQSIKLNPDNYSTHSIRRSKASLIYKVTKNHEAVRELLGQKSIASTSHYLGIDRKKACAIARKVEM